MSEEKTISRQTALKALASLASADAIIAKHLGSINLDRKEAIDSMSKELGVDVKVYRT